MSILFVTPCNIVLDHTNEVSDEILFPPPDPAKSNFKKEVSKTRPPYPHSGFILEIIVFYDNNFQNKFGNGEQSVSK